eukprot:gnl/TRDRNA2_/TRDRNA2_127988_c0_seq1.p1 gnl/TRDRNA2_/TRDRNA2_127988_c0~~gnl/TRDRNA2_/TRDRNA2_127988_c0_seq1.p1  ORF type:complete len:303 (+),score=27.80 gnl/TRDRNA2_/TRDRNA2_127988_c0_seq1:99-1007(+)
MAPSFCRKRKRKQTEEEAFREYGERRRKQLKIASSCDVVESSEPSPPLTPSRLHESHEATCAICLDAVSSEGRGSVQVPCGCKVVYCAPCWDHALAESLRCCGRARCPSCRTSVQAEYDTVKRCLVFSCTSDNGGSADEDQDEPSSNSGQWQRTLQRQTRPLQVELLRQYGASRNRARLGTALEKDIPECSDLPRCVCGSDLRCVSLRATVLPPTPTIGDHFVSARRRLLRLFTEVVDTPSPHTIGFLAPRVTCDLCDQRVPARSTIWLCGNVGATILHNGPYDLCESCISSNAAVGAREVH